MARRRRGGTKQAVAHEKPLNIGRFGFDAAFPVLYAGVFMLVSLAVYLAFFPVGDIGVEADFYSDLVVAAQKLSRGSFSVSLYPYKGPVYSFALILVRTVVRDWYRSGVVLSILCAGGALVLCYRLLAKLFRRKVAVVALIAVSLASEFFNHSHKACSDMLFFLLCCSVIFLLLCGDRSRPRIAAAAVLGALAFLTRYNGVFLPVGAVIVFFVINPHRLSWRRRIADSSLYVLVFLAVCLPWFIASYRETGTVISTRNVENIVTEFYGGERREDIPEGGFDSVSSIVLDDPAYFAGRFLINIPRHVWLDMRYVLGIPYGLLLLLGLVRLCFVHPTRRQGAFYIFALCYFLPMCVVFHLPRFSLPLLPAYAAIGASALFAGGERTAGRGAIFPGLSGFMNRNRGASVLVVTALFIYQVFWIYRTEKRYYASRPLFVLDAARFLKTLSAERSDAGPPVVMARKAHVAYYAGMRYQPYPTRIFDQSGFITYAVEHGVDFLVYSSIEQRQYGTVSFLQSLDSTPGITTIYETPNTVIYELAEWMSIETAAGKRALETLNTRLDEAKAGGDMEEILSSYNALALYYRMNGEYDEMAEQYRRAVEFTGTIEDRRSAARLEGLMKLNLAQAYMLGGRHEDSITLLEESIEGFSRRGDERNIAGSRVLLAKNYWKMDMKNEAVQQLEAAQRIYAALGEGARAAEVGRQIEELEKQGQ